MKACRYALIALFLAPATVLAWPDDPEAVAVVQKYGPTFIYDTNKAGKSITGLNFIGPRVTDDALADMKDSLMQFKRLRSIMLQKTKITDAGLKELKDLKLSALDLTGTKITDAGLKELKAMKRLASLVLKETAVTDAGIAEFKEACPDCQITR